MYYVIKELEVSASHRLKLPYNSKCKQLHGHNWKIKVFCRAKRLNPDGMVTDFTQIKEACSMFDHTNLNNLFDQPTAEHIAKTICDGILNCYRVEVQESSGNTAIYERDEV